MPRVCGYACRQRRHAREKGAVMQASKSAVGSAVRMRSAGEARSARRMSAPEARHGRGSVAV